MKVFITILSTRTKVVKRILQYKTLLIFLFMVERGHGDEYQWTFVFSLFLSSVIIQNLSEKDWWKWRHAMGKHAHI